MLLNSGHPSRQSANHGGLLLPTLPRRGRRSLRLLGVRILRVVCKPQTRVHSYPRGQATTDQGQPQEVQGGQETVSAAEIVYKRGCWRCGRYKHTFLPLYRPYNDDHPLRYRIWYQGRECYYCRHGLNRVEDEFSEVSLVA